ncbi:EutP/PduV family microcompartment system protein [Vagococcus fluvialis]|uniref:EutP/PduV family microcompartment system protein n=1 Tax=Vagococcus fluvialis TaxID=2738 RepID=UPI0014334788|nr:EutP/PduV family microcompartment system protein [Vagococcus fluvialis]MDT2780570.1 EutP/PduV family microcompartment system protein [Vagococcus fluvialis]NKC58856.1 hypothetical protein [Vagococcus fluvialis]NKD49610.1 hypothetical protein [Vagococcus fluvialis]
MTPKKILLVGPRNSGKTTVAHSIEEVDKPIRKKANIVYGKKTIDTPSTYLESPWMRQHIISLQQNAYMACFLFPLAEQKKSYPPGFTHVFRIPVMALVTYTNDELINEAIQQEVLKKLTYVGQFEDFIFLNIENQDELKQIQHYLLRKEVRK